MTQPAHRQRPVRSAGYAALVLLCTILIACSESGLPPAATATRPVTSTAQAAVLPTSTTTAASVAPTRPATAATSGSPISQNSGTPSATSRSATPGSTPGTPALAATGPLHPQTITVPTKSGAGAGTQQQTISLPTGFQISLFTTGLGRTRFLAWSPEGDLVVSETEANGRVTILPDRDHNGVADESIMFVQGLRNPHGLAFHAGYLYIAAENQVVRVRWQGGKAATAAPEVIVPNLPTGGHSTRTIGFGPDSKLYLAVGSSCNICIEQDERRAAIYQYNADGSGGRLYARGLRNAVGFVWQPGQNRLWATNNGRDGLGDDTPPETLNLVYDGADFGWPYCHSGRIADPQFGNQKPCSQFVKPAVEMQAHSAPLGLAFYTGTLFPSDYRGDLFIAFHGSWNRSEPTGYKLVRVRFQDGTPTGTVEDFATGWLPNNSRNAWGRPVDPSVGPDGSLYLTDDLLGVIYRITYAGR